jgi:molybdenum cofactor guanylyltransferase
LSLPHPDGATADGFILAGGRSSRMGSDKALINLAGRPLIQHALDIFRSASLSPQIAGAMSDLSAFAPTLPDDAAQTGGSRASFGPLAGICSALASGTARYAVFLPIDLPFLPASLICYLLHRAVVSDSAITISSVAGFIQTFPVVIDRATLPVLHSSLRSSDRNCFRAFCAAAEALSKPFAVQPVELLVQAGHISHPKGLPAADWFLNVNSARELTRAEAIFAKSVIK